MHTENVQTLRIHKLSQEQYDRTKAEGNLAENAFYLTPDTTADFIVEQGVSGNFAYRKWESGIAECWGIVTDTFQRAADAQPAFGSFYIFGSEYIQLPAGLFAKVPVVNLTCRQPDLYSCILGCGIVLSADMALRQWIYVENAPFTAFEVTYDISAKGRWK